jgi:hypothetical protein
MGSLDIGHRLWDERELSLGYDHIDGMNKELDFELFEAISPTILIFNSIHDLIGTTIGALPPVVIPST